MLPLMRSTYLNTIAVLMFVALFFIQPTGVSAQVTAFKQAVAESAANDKALSQFYKNVDYQAIWTSKSGKDRARRQALLKAIQDSGNHGLPTASYNLDQLMAELKNVKDPRTQGQLEVALSRLFLEYARDVQTGVLKPSRVDSEITRKVPYRDRYATLVAFAKSNPAGFIKALPPKTAEYNRLMKEKIELEKLVAIGGFGPNVSGKSLKPGASGQQVVNLRNRLILMGFMPRNATQTYDATIQSAVQQFQLANGLNPDGVAGSGTLKVINTPAEKRLQSVIVAMERERWTNLPRGKRHVWVNLTDFSAKIIDNGKTTFETRSVIGANDADRRSPEFSDVMEFMVINPSWYVPRSIITKEYLPLLQKNRNAVSHLEITDSKGRKVNRSAVNFASFDEKTFPFAMRQPPSRGNALGLVKFMFPNKYNIYLHDTPAKNLFSREVRAFSHGCIRLNDPFDFAYALLAKQTSDPKGFFHAKLDSGKESRVNLQEHVPVHIGYRTAFTSAKGRMNYRRDIYGRDAKIWNALAREGVALRAIQG